MDIDSLWDFNQPAVSEGRFTALLDQAASPDYEEVLTQLARAQGLQHRFDAAHHTLDQVAARLTPAMPRVQIRYELERGRVFNSSGDAAAAKPLFLAAWERAVGHGEDALAVDAAHMVAIVETGDAIMAWNLKAVALAEASSDERARRWMGSLLNNIGWTQHDQGAYAEALTSFQKALAAQHQYGSAEKIHIAEWCVARALRSLNQIDAALAILVRLDAEDAADGYVAEEMGECLLLQGRDDEAAPFFATAYALLSSDTWLAQHEAARLERLRRLGAG